MSEILQQLDLTQIILYYGGQTTTSPNRYICPYCRGIRSNSNTPEPSLGIFSTQEGYDMYKCHRQKNCGMSGNALTMIKHFEGLEGEEDFSLIINKCKELGFLSNNNRQNRQNISSSNISERISVVNRKYKESLENKNNRNIKRYLDSRNINEGVISSLYGKVGYDINDDSLVFPIEAPSGGVIAIHKIKAHGNDTFRHGNNKQTFGPKSKGFFFCGSDINDTHGIILVEGIIDALSIVSVCPQYCVISSTGIGFDINLLEPHQRKKLIVCYDNDKEHKAGERGARKIAKEFGKIKIVDYNLYDLRDENDIIIKTYKDMNEILMENREDVITDIVNNPKILFGITVELEDNNVVYKQGDNIKINALKLIKYLIKKNKIICHDGGLIYSYNGKCFEEVTEMGLFASIYNLLKLDKYKILLKGQLRNDIKSFLHDQTYMSDKKQKDEQNQRYLSLDDCLYDLDKECFLNHTHNIFTTNSLPYKKTDIQTIKNTFFEKWLMSTFDVKNRNSIEDVKYLQEIMGYSLYRGMPKPVLFFVIGKPGTGKSTFLDLMEMLLGPENVSAISVQKFNDPPYLAKLHNKLVNVCGETVKDIKKYTDILKDLTGNGVITAKHLYENPFQFKNHAKIIFAMNDLPIFIDDTFALYDRIYLLKFDKIFRNTDNEILEIYKKFKPELPIIFNWALKGLKRLKDNNFRFTIPESMDILKYEYKRDNDPVYDFHQECLTIDDNGQISARELQECYKKYMMVRHDEKGLRPSDFKRAICAKEGVQYLRTNTNRYYSGVKFNDKARKYMEEIL